MPLPDLPGARWKRAFTPSEEHLRRLLHVYRLRRLREGLRQPGRSEDLAEARRP